LNEFSAQAAVKGETGGMRYPELVTAAGAIALLLLISASRGFESLWDSKGDNDSVLRLTEVRDLLAGQSWFDLTQYRLGPEGGVVMHWSRLVDAPIAALIKLGMMFGASQTMAEYVALTVWPAFLLGVCTWLLVRISRIVYGDEAIFPAAAVGAITLIWMGIFTPARIDHHNMQLALSLGLLLGLVKRTFVGGFAAGVCAAASIAIGMETMPFVAIAGATTAIIFLVRGEAEAANAGGFGLGFAISGALFFVATVPFSAWGAVTCDAYSTAQASAAVLAGLGLFAITSNDAARRSLMVRAGATAALGLGLGLLALTQFPQCLADPYASLDPRLRELWLDDVIEAQSLFDTLRNDPLEVLALYATPALALVVLAWRGFRAGLSRDEIIVAALLAGAFAISVWQVRGAQFAQPLAVVVFAGWVARNRTGDGLTWAAARGVAVWLLSINVVWTMLYALLSPERPERITTITDTDEPVSCYQSKDYAALAALPATTVLAISNLGSSIITNTPHRALAGPYHRNTAGNLTVFDTLLAKPDEAQKLTIASGATIIVNCPGNAETGMFAKTDPGSLSDRLKAGRPPAWLKRIPGDGPLEIYAVLPVETTIQK